MSRQHTVTKCIWHVTYWAERKDSVIPEEATPDFTGSVHPLFLRRFSRDLKATISMWRPTNMTTLLSSPHRSNQCQFYKCINRLVYGYHRDQTCEIVSLTLFIQCLAVATEWASSRRRGKSAANTHFRCKTSIFICMMNWLSDVNIVIYFLCETNLLQPFLFNRGRLGRDFYVTLSLVGRRVLCCEERRIDICIRTGEFWDILYFDILN